MLNELNVLCRVIEIPPVEIKENDVCVRMLAAPINPSDINRIEGSIAFLLSFVSDFSFTWLQFQLFVWNRGEREREDVALFGCCDN